MKKQIYAYEGALHINTDIECIRLITKERDPSKKSIEIYATQNVVESYDGELKLSDLELYNVNDFVICNTFPKSDEKQEVYNLFEQLEMDAQKYKDFISLITKSLENNLKIV